VKLWVTVASLASSDAFHANPRFDRPERGLRLHGRVMFFSFNYRRVILFPETSKISEDVSICRSDVIIVYKSRKSSENKK